MDIDRPCDKDPKTNKDPTNDTRLQGLRELANKLGSRPAGDDDEDIDSEDNSDDSSEGYGGFHDRDLFLDEDSNEDDEDRDIDFGPYDEENYGDDSGFGEF